MSFMQVLLRDNLWFSVKKAVTLVGLCDVKTESANVRETLPLPL